MSNEAPTDALRLVPVEPTHQMHYDGDRALAKAISIGGSIFDTTKAIWAAMLSAAPASPLPGGGDEKSEDEKFIREYPEAVRKGDWERIARLLSGRLRQMDKRSKAANTRADVLIAELKEARGLLTEAKSYFAPDEDAVAMLVRVDAFLARNGKGEG